MVRRRDLAGNHAPIVDLGYACAEAYNRRCSQVLNF